MISLENDINSPIHSGMVSLVYKGRMTNGKGVVIKVLRNKINETLVRDYASIQFLLDIIVYFFNSDSGSLVEVFAEFKNSILSQTGFKQEQDNLIRMRHNFKNVDQVVIPDVYEIFNKTNENIIVMEYLDGKTIFEITDVERDKYVNIIFEMMAKSILYDGMFHGDLHPGNIIFLKEDGVYKIGLIDFGIIDTITRDDQYGFFIIVKNIYLGYDECIKKRDEFIETFIGPVDVIKQMNEYDYTTLSDLITKNVIDCLFYNPSCLNINNLYKLNTIISKYGLCINKNISKSVIAFVIADRFCVKLSPNKTYKTKINEIFELFDGVLLEDEVPE
jgi:predicted unusual protein kinase regulating ubiquinone biosynthesis (AarF/ABC1/UbiB family)